MYHTIHFFQDILSLSYLIKNIADIFIEVQF